MAYQKKKKNREVKGEIEKKWKNLFCRGFNKNLRFIFYDEVGHGAGDGAVAGLSQRQRWLGSETNSGYNVLKNI